MRTPFSHGPVDPEVAAAQAEARKRRKIIFAFITALLLVVGYFLLAAFLPRWWGRQVGRWCDDTFTKGLLYGLAFGLICTFVPLVVASTVFYKRLNHQARVVILTLAVLIAAPNLLTLSIATHTGSGSHAGDRYMDVSAPFFRGATLIGAIVAAILFALTVWQYRAGQRVRKAKRASKQRAGRGNAASTYSGEGGSGNASLSDPGYDTTSTTDPDRPPTTGTTTNL